MISRVPSEAAAILDEDTLVLADLHIGFESELAEKGIRIPDQSSKILKRILELKQKANARTLIVLGDLKHTVPRIPFLSWLEVPRFMEQIVKHFERTVLIPGNHDGNIEPLIPRKVELVPTQGISVGNVWLLHGHTRLSDDALKSRLILMGHIHPAIQLRDESGYAYTHRIWLRGKTKLNSTPEIMVFPAFNDFMGQLLLNRERGPYVDRGLIFSGGLVDIDRLDVESLDLTYLGKLGSL